MCSWPKLTFGDGLPSFGLETHDVNNPRSFLRLIDGIEKAFDRKWLTLTPEFLTNDSFRLRLTVLKPEILNTSVVDNSRAPFAPLHNTLSGYAFSQAKKPDIN
jgi:hypothetical protein